MAIFNVTNLNDSGIGSLRQAIVDANALTGEDFITFDPLLSGQTITLVSDELLITDDLEIDGDLDNNGSADITIQREASVANAFRIFKIDDGDFFETTPVILDGLVISGGSDTIGGGIFTIEDLTIINSSIVGNSADSGGGIYAYDYDYGSNPGPLSISGSIISNNIATRSGGGIFGAGSIKLTDSIVSENASSGKGGGLITKRGADTKIKNSTINNNTAESGGGIAIDYAGNLVVDDSIISGNSAQVNGGGIHTDIAPLFSSRVFGYSIITVNDSVISGNSTTKDNGHGGGIFNQGAELTTNNTLISNNSTQGNNSHGGGIFVAESRGYDLAVPGYVAFGSLAVNDSTIRDNSTIGDNSHGGGIYSARIDLEVSNSTISGNTTLGNNSDGGGIYGSGANISISNSTLSSNESLGVNSDGGAVQSISREVLAGNFSDSYITLPGKLTLANSTVSGNATSGFGGGINSTQYNELLLRNSTITSNKAPAGQGSGVAVYAASSSSFTPNGYYYNSDTFSISSSIVAGNVNSDLDLRNANPFVKGDNNLIGISNNLATFAQGNNIIDVTDPGLEPLADNGGPTQTHRLRPDSIAINAGSNPNGLSTDQRGNGFVRAVNGQPDIGAFEIQASFPVLTLAIDPTSISENGGMATATVTRNINMTEALTVSLSSSDTSEAVVSENLVIPMGEDFATFQVNGVDDAVVDGTQTSVIKASAPGFADSTVTLEITDNEVAALTLVINSTSISENGGMATAIVMRNTDTTEALTVMLSSSDTSEVGVPESVVIPKDKDSAIFQLTGMDDAIVDGTQTSIITATASDFADGMATLDITDDEGIASSNSFFFSVDDNSMIGDLTVADEDIILFNGTDFSTFFDGSDVLSSKVEVSALDVINNTEILLSFDKALTIEGVGLVDDSDVVKFTADSLGEGNTVGSFQMYLDGSTLGLTRGSEDIDALTRMPDGSLIFSTTGNTTLSSGLKSKDEDLIRFDPLTGETFLYFDGSDVELTTRGEDLDAVGIKDEQLLLSTTGAFTVDGLSGKDEDAFSFMSSSLGSVTLGSFGEELFFDGSELGITGDLSGIDFLD